MYRILVTLPVTEEHKTLLESQDRGGVPCEFTYIDGDGKADELSAGEMDMIIGCPPVSVVPKLRKLSFLQLHSAGYETYAAPGVLPEGTLLANASGAYGLAVSEHMLAMTFDVLRHFGRYHDQQREKVWVSDGYYHSVEGAVTVVVGLGDIGGDYARKMKALGAYVIGIRKHDKPAPDYVDEQYTIDRLPEVLPRADIAAIVAPGGPETYHLFDEKALSSMKDDSILINVGRGSEIDPVPLKRLIKEGKFYGVALDVTEPEPLPEDDELWDLPGVLITPHSAGRFFLPETVTRIVRIAAKNVYALSHGTDFVNVVAKGSVISG